MSTTRKIKITFWSATVIIFLFEGVMPALTSNTDLAKEGIRHLGYPDYFRVMLTIFKVLGAFTLILSSVPQKVKEWAYAGFGITMIAAFVSHWVVDGPSGQTFFPLIMFAILATSYIFYGKLKRIQQTSSTSIKPSVKDPVLQAG
ncbi:MAG TPA: DoxX family protein [Flavitalea sp.]|nr:DoxX family protein [Flavitalea sp.]